MSEVLRLLIADDEQIVLDGIKFMVEKAFPDIEIVAMVNSGREAIEACQRVIPDIVFMDIKMPGINGIEAIEKIKKRHQDTRFIVISAYEQFEYAKQAVELGVSEYILKPVTPAKLKGVLDKVIGQIEEEREQRYREIRNQEKLQKILPVLEHGFIYSLLMNNSEEMIKYQELFEVKKEMAYMMIFEFGEGNQHKDIQNKIGIGVKSQSIYTEVQSTMKYKCKCVVGPMIINRMTVMVYEDAFEKEYEQRLEAMTLADQILKSIKELIGSDIYIGIGSCYPLNKIKNSLEEADNALSKIGDENILHINDISEQKPKEKEYTYVEVKDDQMHIVQLVENGQEVLLDKALNHFFNKIQKEFGNNVVDIQHIITELMVMILSISYKNKLDENEVGYSTYLSELKRHDSFIEVRNWCIRKILYITRKVGSKKEQHVSKVVKKAKDYIDQRYNQEINLMEVSKEVSVSPQYFSKIFKEEMGVSFVEYVRAKRMDVAKDMLKAKTYSVKEICYEIGYNDPNYFSRLFKKLVGVSPTDFE